MSPVLKFLEAGALQADGILLPGARGRCALAATGDELPQVAHVFLGHDLVAGAAKEENGRRCGDERDLGGRVPLLVAEEGEGGECGEGVGDELGEGGEGVFEDERVDLLVG